MTLDERERNAEDMKAVAGDGRVKKGIPMMDAVAEEARLQGRVRCYM